jgi:hypothetical protein
MRAVGARNTLLARSIGSVLGAGGGFEMCVVWLGENCNEHLPPPPPLNCEAFCSKKSIAPSRFRPPGTVAGAQEKFTMGIPYIKLFWGNIPGVGIARAGRLRCAHSSGCTAPAATCSTTRRTRVCRTVRRGAANGQLDLCR